MEEERKNYKILAENIEDFTAVEEGYKEFTKHFSIKGCNYFLLEPGFNTLSDKKMKVDILPLLEIMGIKGIDKISSDLEWSIISAGEERWIVRGKNYDYMIHAKRLEC